MSDGLRYDVFISYKHDPDAFLDMFFAILKRTFQDDTINYWYDQDIKAGTEWRVEIDNAIRAARMVLVIITPEAVLSQYMTYEWCYALGLGKPIIPVLLKGKEDDVHIKLREFQHLDFRFAGQPWDKLSQRVKDLREDSISSSVSINGDNVVAEIKELIKRRGTKPIEVDDIITALMHERILSYTQVRSLQDLIGDHRARLNAL